MVFHQLKKTFYTKKADNDDIIITIRLLVKGNKVGTIIGKGGDRITAMRKESGCTIKIQGQSQKKTFQFHGYSIKNIF